jgi:molybdopterin/thiamine biosynthesis adenylyltransferase
MNVIDTRRHLEVFSVELFGNKRIDIIGAGAVGSAIAVQVAKLGLENIHVWDFDTVEGHNIANQRYELKHIDQPKGKAIAAIIKEATAHDIEVHEHKLEGGEALGEVVFLAVDTMAARKAIWQKSLRNKLRTKLVIETRMGAEEGRVYAICPVKPAQVRGYETTFYDDAETVVSACGASTTVGATADMTASYAVWQFIRWAAIEASAESASIAALSGQVVNANEAGKAPKDVLDHELIFGLRPPYIMTRQFK